MIQEGSNLVNIIVILCAKPRPYAGSELICFDRLKGSRQAFLDMGYAELCRYPLCWGCKMDVKCGDVWVGMACARSGRADFGSPNHPILGLFWVASQDKK